MKKLFLTVSAFMSMTAVCAQETLIGVRGGLNLSTISLKSDNALGIDRSRILPSFNIGLIADIPIDWRLFSFQPSLTLSGKGVKSDIPFAGGDFLTVELNPFYVNLQTNVVVNIIPFRNLRVFVGAGPYVGVGVFGTANIKGRLAWVDIDDRHDIHFTSNKSDISPSELSGYANMKRMDFGGNAVAGVFLLRGLMVALNYEHGLVNLQPGTDDNESDFGKNRSFNISLGLAF